jgi:uncharacterized protein (TIGR02145 family)
LSRLESSHGNNQPGIQKGFQFRLILGLICISLLAVPACKKDDVNGSGGDSNSPVANIEVDIVVLATDEQGEDMQGVELTINGVTGITDQFGTCIFKQIAVPSNRFYVGAEKQGYFSTGFGGIPQANQVQYVRIKLLSKGNPTTFSGTSTGSITTTDNAQVVIQPNTVIDANGVVHNGQVKAYARMLNQDDPEFPTLFPGGDLASVNSSGELTQLESYGMLGVELEDMAGNRLNLNGNTSADVRFPIAASQLSSAPDSIPLLHFDEEKGVWLQEGYAYKNGSYYEGSVKHFSWWNCDVPLPNPVPIIKGKVVDCFGNPVPGCVVSVNNTYTLTTNSLGEYSNWIPAGINVVVSVNPQLNSNIYPAVSSQSVFINPGLNLVPDIVLNCPATITGQAVDCEGLNTPVYVRAIWPNGSTMLLYFPNGNFQLSVATTPNIQLTLFNGTAFKDTTLSISSWGANLSLGNIAVCEITAGTGCSGITSVTDIDGNTYDVISIGNQCWMKQNLKTTRYRNGTQIAGNLSSAQWSATSSGAYAAYNDNQNNVNNYGNLYNFYAVVDPSGLCPTGWHVPTDNEWDQMINVAGGVSYAGGHLKDTGTVQLFNGLWQSPNTAADNLTGFDGQPGGYRNYNGVYSGLGYTGYWASSSTGTAPDKSWFRQLNHDLGAVIKNDNDKRIGFSVRCVKD